MVFEKGGRGKRKHEVARAETRRAHARDREIIAVASGDRGRARGAEAEEAGARETLRSVLETSLNAEVTTLSAAIREEEAVKEEKAIRVIAMSSETFVCVVPRRFLEVTKMVCDATARDAPAQTAPWRVTEVSVCQGKGELSLIHI